MFELDKFSLVGTGFSSFYRRMSHDRPPHLSLSSVWLPVALMLAALLLRVLVQTGVVTGLPNFSPLMAFAFAGSVVFPRHLPWWSWAIVLLGVDWFCDGASFWKLTEGRPEILLSYGCYAFAAWWGSRLRGRAGIVDTLIGTLACSVLFYVVTNSLCWWVKPYYAKDLAGWVQALTIGKPDVQPTTLEFFRNSLAADMAGATLLVLAYNAEALFRKLRRLPWMSKPESLRMA